MNLKDHPGVVYLNCESNKVLPFKNQFKTITVTDPLTVYQAFDEVEKKPEIHTLVIDTATYLMDMYESLYVLPSTNTMKMWGEYAQYWKKLMSQYVAKSTKNVIILAHTMDVLNESEMVNETLVKIKGSVMNQGIESYFSTVISSKKVPLRTLDKYGSKLLNITDDDEMLGFKYVFQTKLTKDTVNERIRGSLGLWDTAETYIDNDCQLVIDRLHEYYN